MPGVWGCPAFIRTSPCRTRESRGAQPLWRGSGGIPAHIRTPSVLKAGVQRAPPFGRGLGVSPAHIRTPSVLKAGVQRAPPFGRGLGVSPRDLIFSPLPSRKGVRGMVRATSETTLPRSGGTARRRHPRLLRCTRNDRIGREWQCLACPGAEGGVQRAQPLWQGSRSALPISTSPCRTRESRGRRPLAGV